MNIEANLYSVSTMASSVTYRQPASGVPTYRPQGGATSQTSASLRQTQARTRMSPNPWLILHFITRPAPNTATQSQFLFVPSLSPVPSPTLSSIFHTTYLLRFIPCIAIPCIIALRPIEPACSPAGPSPRCSSAPCAPTLTCCSCCSRTLDSSPS